MKKRATIADVAHAAGVSTATVSYVLNKSATQSISPATTERVMNAVQELHYRRNDAARSLKSNKTNRVGVSINHPISIKSHAASLQSVLQALREQGLCAYLNMGSKEDSSAMDCIDSYLSGNVDGIILLGEAREKLSSECEDKIVSMGIPCVTHNIDSGRNIASVSIDFFSSAYCMAMRLIDEGAKRLFYYMTNKSSGIDRERQQAISRAAYQRDIPFQVLEVEDSLSLEDSGSEFPHTLAWQDGYDRMLKAISSLHPDDAVIVGWCEHVDHIIVARENRSDMPYIGVLSHLTDRVISEPRIFYDCIPSAVIGRECVKLLLSQEAGSLPTHSVIKSEIH